MLQYILWFLVNQGAVSATPLRKHVRGLEVFQNTCLRRSIGVTRLDRVSNVRLRSKCCDQPSISQLIFQARLRWLGHLGRLPDTRLCKQILFAGTVPGQPRPRGKPRRRWNELVSDDVKELNLTGRARWHEVCMQREQWRSVIAGAVSGPARNAM